MPRTLFIDADACPVTRESIDCARRAGVAVVVAGNSTQNLERHIRRDDPRDAEHARRGFWVTTLDVSVGADSADFAIVERLQAGDVVVTQDIGLASMCSGAMPPPSVCAGASTTKRPSTCNCLFATRKRRCAAPADALADRRHLPAKTALALSATSPNCCANQGRFFGTCPKIYLFVLAAGNALVTGVDRKTCPNNLLKGQRQKG